MSEGASLLTASETSLILDELAEAADDVPFLDAEAARATPDVRSFALGRESFRPAERLTGLERMGEKLARALRGMIEPFSHARTQISAVALEIRRFDEWQADLPYFTSLSHYRLRPLKGGMLIALEPDFIAGLVESFFGGSTMGRPPKTGEFTPSEEMVLVRLLDRLVALLMEHWNEVLPLEAALAARETSSVHIGFVRPEESIVVQQFTILAGAHRASTLSIIYPLAMLRPIEERMGTKVHDEDTHSPGNWRVRLAGALQQVQLPVRSVLARPEISVAQLLALKAGDVIPITISPRTPLLAGSRRIAEGAIGEQDGRAALMIDKVGNI